MNLYWGVCPMRQQQQCSTEDMTTTAETQLHRGKHVENGDVMGVVAGTQMSTGSTNFMRLHVVTREEERKALRRKRGGKA